MTHLYTYSAPWEWLANNRNHSLEYYSPIYGDDDDQSEEWRVIKISGSINDREFDIVGRGVTPLEAVQSAMASDHIT